jgi:signal transduction histidine kinase
MNPWIEANAGALVVVAAAACVVLLLAVVALLVAWLRARRAAARALAATSERQSDRTELELQVAELAARLRIIREMHEVAVLELTRIIGQADGAKYASKEDPSAGVRAAAAMGEGASTVLADLRRVMGAVGDSEADVAHAPLTDLDELVAGFRDSGLAIEVQQSGEPFELKHGAELAVHRILQECLTNALEFGGEGTEATVTLTWTEDSLRIAVDDDGVRAASRREGLDPNEVSRQRAYDETGHMEALTGVNSGLGIAEMRDRAELFGGVFAAQPVPGVGFSVSVVFPGLRYNNGVHSVKLDPA